MFDDTIAKLNFWYAKKFFKPEKDFKFMLDVNNTSAITVEIIRKYPETVVEYNNLIMGDNGLLNFNMTVIANPLAHNVDDNKFKNFANYIMMAVIAEAVSNTRNVDENRAIDPFEYDEKRDFLEEIPPIPEVRVSKRKPRKKAVRGNQGVRSEVQSGSESSGD